MRITVVLPHEQHLETAGVRIRYRRIEPALRRLGHRLELRLLDGFDPKAKLDSDAYLFCKCQDARSVILARRIAEAGRPVGLDVFDDYYSQGDDSRLVHRRRWWGDILPHASFLLCATPVMAERLAGLAPALPTHVLNDPFEPFDPASVAARIEAKAAHARESGVLEVAWFGMGDNPTFPVGLDDLSAFGTGLAGLRSTGLSPRLRVLTNRRAMTPARMEGLARLPIPVGLGEWSVEAEAALLRESLLCLLPVNAQPFSTVKSLNRAVTALTSGTQVLSLGHPLYEALGAFVYRSAEEFLGDLSVGRLRLRRETLPALAATLAEKGAPEAEARRLGAFLAGFRPAKGRAVPGRSGAVIHGVESSGLVHDFAQRQGWLSVASPFCDATFDADIRFEESPGGAISVLLSERACAFLRAEDRERLEPAGPEAPGPRRLVIGGETFPVPATDHIAERIVLYPAVLAGVRRLIERLFPGTQVVLSELASPYAEEARAA